MRMLKKLAKAALVAVAGITALLGALWLDHTRTTMLPVPTGPFAVGRTMYVWSDPVHRDALAPRPAIKREILAWIWYPASSDPALRPMADYLPPPWRRAVERQRGTFIDTFLTRDLSRVRPHSMQDANVSSGHPTYPVILMRAGLAALTTSYTALAEDLASHGYVVVGFDAPYRSSVVVLPNGKVIPRAPGNNTGRVKGAEQERLAIGLVQAWSVDMRFALDQLSRLNSSDPAGRFLGRLEMQRVGVFGHSLGGAAALQFCHDDPRCKAGIDVDGAPLGDVIADGVSKPFMFILSEHGQGGDTDAEGRRIMDNIRSIYDRLPPDRRSEIVIRGANHYMFSDDGAMLKSPLLMRGLRTLGIVHLDGRRQIAVTEHCIRGFFDVYLQSAPASDLVSLKNDPEVEYVR